MTENQIHWTKIFGNPFKYALHPLMLTKEGYKLKTTTPLKGESKKEKFPVEIVFDESYAVEKIARVLEQLQPRNYNEWQGIVSKAYACWNEKKKQQN
ncbi:hypothetical protein [Nostoc sp. FACHB-280]|uniref:hypothetical protein n=1 Tax=Nostoc sp. FACHB-280 TaxID=2692839 RepID=UPI00168AAD54|nr:hypothetical protein [Nostoc sp. FACHB-280]MBD2495000.1 hypothetical protein [Nostoc sp. FACHB-280]